jgi:hypothetical protein
MGKRNGKGGSQGTLAAGGKEKVPTCLEYLPQACCCGASESRGREEEGNSPQPNAQ